MTHREWIENTFDVLAKTDNAILYIAHGEMICEINGQMFDCKSVDEFHQMVEIFGDDSFEE